MSNELIFKRLPASKDANAATVNEITIDGPASFLATEPVSTYTPAPSVLPTPKKAIGSIDWTFIVTFSIKQSMTQVCKDQPFLLI